MSQFAFLQSEWAAVFDSAVRAEAAVRANLRSAQMEEFRQVLPALSRSQIQVLLRELRGEGSIHSVGVTKAARWYPGVGRQELQP